MLRTKAGLFPGFETITGVSNLPHTHQDLRMREPALPLLDTRLAAIPKNYREVLAKLLLRRIVASGPRRGFSILGAISIKFISICIWCQVFAARRGFCCLTQNPMKAERPRARDKTSCTLKSVWLFRGSDGSAVLGQCCAMLREGSYGNGSWEVEW